MKTSNDSWNLKMMQIEGSAYQLPPRGSWLYVMASSRDYGRAKIGMTTQSNPMRRFATLRCGDPFLFLRVAFYLPHDCPVDAGALERRLHVAFGPSRIQFLSGGCSEWFYIEDDKAEFECQRFIENFFEDPECVRPFSDIAYVQGSQILKAYIDDLISLFGPPPVLHEDGLPY
ncbi:GIY-YIG nuclease family protein [Pelomonas sp. Root1217]|uniref:GIY-YIG nuclease family protein n=1 Tax=Pelomonas sp. Root1217 TaxID=1736430 RepID=UPI000710922D|nr:GIY-YIG nuclease family protein [Pelomonas sp. Root1217]